MPAMHNPLRHNIAEAMVTMQQLAALEPAVTRAAELIAGSLTRGGKLLTCGNGGSAADAAHMATEFVCRYRDDRRPYPALCLAVSGGDITAIGNDYDFLDLFARQVHAFGQEGDVLIAFTTSGRSPNVERALQAAKKLGVSTVSLLGRDGGACCGLADVELLVPGTLSARIQEAHKLLLHTICEMVEQVLPKE